MDAACAHRPHMKGHGATFMHMRRPERHGAVARCTKAVESAEHHVAFAVKCDPSYLLVARYLSGFEVREVDQPCSDTTASDGRA